MVTRERGRLCKFNCDFPLFRFIRGRLVARKAVLDFLNGLVVRGVGVLGKKKNRLREYEALKVLSTRTKYVKDLFLPRIKISNKNLITPDNAITSSVSY